MAQSYTAKGTAVAKSSGTSLTIPNLSMTGGDFLLVCIAYDPADNAGPADITYGTRDISNDGQIEGKSFTSGNFRLRMYGAVIANSKTRDLVVNFNNATAARLVTACSLHQGTKVNVTNDGENTASTISVTGGAQAQDHINSIHMGFHLTNGPAGDSIGSSSTSHTLGQRVGTTGDTDTSNITLQETYQILSAPTVLATATVIGDDYQIKTVGTTDWTAIGATSNTVGEIFTATGVGTGTGDAYHFDPLRSRLTGLTSRDHIGIMGHFRPKRTYIITDVVQNHRIMNQNPDWVEVRVEDDRGAAFWINIDPDQFDDWSDAVVTEYITKYVATWEVNNIDSNLTYEADSTRDTRMATFVDDQVVI